MGDRMLAAANLKLLDGIYLHIPLGLPIEGGRVLGQPYPQLTDAIDRSLDEVVLDVERLVHQHQGETRQ